MIFITMTKSVVLLILIIFLLSVWLSGPYSVFSHKYMTAKIRRNIQVPLSYYPFKTCHPRSLKHESRVNRQNFCAITTCGQLNETIARMRAHSTPQISGQSKSIRLLVVHGKLQENYIERVESHFFTNVTMTDQEVNVLIPEIWHGSIYIYIYI